MYGDVISVPVPKHKGGSLWPQRCPWVTGWNPSSRYFARSLPRRGGPSVEALTGPSSPVVQVFVRLPAYPACVACTAGSHWGGGLFGRRPDFPVFRKTPFPPPFFFHPYFLFSSLLSFSFSSQMESHAD